MPATMQVTRMATLRARSMPRSVRQQSQECHYHTCAKSNYEFEPSLDTHRANLLEIGLAVFPL